MNFDKYEKNGAYHWEWFAKGHPTYTEHVRRVVAWVAERPCLDVGCGDGLITGLLGRGVLGIDTNQVAVDMALRRGVDVRCVPISVAAAEFGIKFKAVLMSELIEHLDNPASVLMCARDLLDQDGKLYVTTPPKADKLHDPYHVREYSAKELVDVVESCGFEAEGPVDVVPEIIEMYAKFRKV